MATKKIWTSQYRRIGVAVYAESGRRDLEQVVAQLDTVMSQPGAEFYRLESDSVLVGYVIEVNGEEVDSYLRPHLKQLATS